MNGTSNGTTTGEAGQGAAGAAGAGAGAGAGAPGGAAGQGAGAGGAAGAGGDLPGWLTGAKDHGATDDDLGRITKRGWKHPFQIAKSFFSLEEKLGARQDQTILKPTPGDPESEKQYLKAIGVPEKADGYEIPLPEAENDAEFATGLKELGIKHRVPKVSLEGFLKDANALAEARQSRQDEEAKATAQEEERQLKKEQGGRFKQFVGIADFASRKLGLTPADHAQLVAARGYKATMQLLNKLGTAMTEDGTYGSEGPAGEQPSNMSPAEAQRVLDDKLRDQTWYKNWEAGGTAERELYRQLLKAGARPGR